MALEEVFLAIESRLFVGRHAERHALGEMLRLSAQSPVAVYIHGPRDVGKSALLRAFLRQSGRPLVALRGAEAAQGAQVILQLLSQRLAALGVAAEPALGSVRAGLQQAAHGEAGFILAVDGYDELGAAERWLREEILYHLGAGCLLILCGRSSPAQLWPVERVWRAFVRPLPLEELPGGEADEFLERQGVSQRSLRSAALETVGGSPRHLLAAADSLQAGFPCNPSDVSGRVLEQVLHPGSRRTQWRAGGSGGDELVAAAAVLPFVRRELLRIAVGAMALEEGWELLMRITHPDQEGYAIGGRLRESLERYVLEVRPWQARRWREAVLLAAIARLRAHRSSPLSAQDWREICALSQRAPWFSSLHPPAEAGQGWTMQRGDLQEHEVASLPGASAADIALCETLLERSRASVATLRDRQGELVAWLLLVPVPARGEPLALHARWGALPQGKGLSGHVQGLILAAAGERETAPGGIAVLVRETVTDWLSARRVFAETGSLRGPRNEDLLQALGFQALAPQWRWSAFEVQGHAHQLMRRLTAPRRVPAPPERDRAVKEALLRLYDGDLAGTSLQRYLQERDGVAADAGAYLRDALRSADLGRPAGSGRELLRLYYVERLGGHEAVAERLHLSRATYFRLHKQAIARLAAALFA